MQLYYFRYFSKNVLENSINQLFFANTVDTLCMEYFRLEYVVVITMIIVHSDEWRFENLVASFTDVYIVPIEL